MSPPYHARQLARNALERQLAFSRFFCWGPAEKEFKPPKYASWPGYENGLPFIARRYCALWGRGT